MLEAFFSDVAKAINDVASEVGSPDEPPIHLYFYTRLERDLLMDAVDVNLLDDRPCSARPFGSKTSNRSAYVFHFTR